MPKQIYLCPWCGKPFLDSSLASSYQTRSRDILDAAKEGTVDDLRYFVEQRGDSVNTKHKTGNTPLHYAAGFNEDLAVLDYLICEGALVNATNVLGSTPLHYAANFTGNINVIRHLIRAGAVVNARKHPPDGQTPLDMVKCNIHADHWKIRNLLRKSGGMSGKGS